MSKTLILFRHGKSDWGAAFSSDHERPLAKRGIRDSKVMGRMLAHVGKVPDLVVSSSAVRARTTVELAAGAGHWACPVETTDRLYATDARRVLELIKALPVETERVLLAGHEPTWSSLAERLSGGGQLRMPTAAMVCLQFPVPHWSDVEFGGGQLLWLLPPKLIR